jgi:tetratricopeptide (TPR) repeat protein
MLSAARSDRERARASALFGEIELYAGDAAAAIDALERARALDSDIEQTDWQVAEALGRAYAEAFEYEAAIAVFLRSRDAAANAGDIVGEMRFGALLANAYADSGNFASAEDALGRALALADATRDPLSRARLLWSQSRLHALQNDTRTAAKYARRALEILDVSDHAYYAALAHQLLAHIELDRGNGEAALDLLERAAPLIEASGRPFERASFALERARALMKTGQREEAAAIAMEASATLADLSPIDSGRSYAVIAEVFAELGQLERATELYELAIERLEATPNRYVVEAYSRLASLLEEQGRPGDALAVLKRAMNVQQHADRLLAPRESE